MPAAGPTEIAVTGQGGHDKNPLTVPAPLPCLPHAHPSNAHGVDVSPTDKALRHMARSRRTSNVAAKIHGTRSATVKQPHQQQGHDGQLEQHGSQSWTVVGQADGAIDEQQMADEVKVEQYQREADEAGLEEQKDDEQPQQWPNGEVQQQQQERRQLSVCNGRAGSAREAQMRADCADNDRDYCIKDGHVDGAGDGDEDGRGHVDQEAEDDEEEAGAEMVMMTTAAVAVPPQGPEHDPQQHDQTRRVDTPSSRFSWSQGFLCIAVPFLLCLTFLSSLYDMPEISLGNTAALFPFDPLHGTQWWWSASPWNARYRALYQEVQAVERFHSHVVGSGLVLPTHKPIVLPLDDLIETISEVMSAGRRVLDLLSTAPPMILANTGHRLQSSTNDTQLLSWVTNGMESRLTSWPPRSTYLAVFEDFALLVCSDFLSPQLNQTAAVGSGFAALCHPFIASHPLAKALEPLYRLSETQRIRAQQWYDNYHSVIEALSQLGKASWRMERISDVVLQGLKFEMADSLATQVQQGRHAAIAIRKLVLFPSTIDNEAKPLDFAQLAQLDHFKALRAIVLASRVDARNETQSNGTPQSRPGIGVEGHWRAVHRELAGSFFWGGRLGRREAKDWIGQRLTWASRVE